MDVVERVKAVPLRWAIPAAMVVLVIIVFAAVDIHPSLGHVNAMLLTGSERGSQARSIQTARRRPGEASPKWRLHAFLVAQ